MIELRRTDNVLLDPKFVMENLTELEDRSCQNNIFIDGIPERSSEIWKICNKEVIKIIIMKSKIDITDGFKLESYPVWVNFKERN